MNLIHIFGYFESKCYYAKIITIIISDMLWLRVRCEDRLNIILLYAKNYTKYGAIKTVRVNRINEMTEK